MAVRAGGSSDPRATRAAAVIATYLEAEQARATRQRVWRVVAVAGLVLWSLYATTSTVTSVDLAFGIPLLGLAGVAAGANEWRVRKLLDTLLEETRE